MHKCIHVAHVLQSLSSPKERMEFVALIHEEKVVCLVARRSVVCGGIVMNNIYGVSFLTIIIETTSHWIVDEIYKYSKLTGGDQQVTAVTP
jgi:hypothetical protein